MKFVTTVIKQVPLFGLNSLKNGGLKLLARIY